MDGFALFVVAVFATGWAVDAAGRRTLARYVTVGAWVSFAAFWALLFPHFAFEQKSFVEGAGTAVAVPASLYVAYLLYRGRESLLPISRGVAVMGAIYMPFQVFPSVAAPVIAVTVDQVAFIIQSLGHDPAMVQGPELGEELGVQNAFVFTLDGHRYLTEVVLACTGLGSISIFAGLVAAVKAPREKKLKALAVAVPVIYFLNLLRVTFIALAHGLQWFRADPLVGPVLWLFGSTDVNKVSYFVADRIISQSLSVLALVVIAMAVVRVLPQLVTIFEELLFVVTGSEYDLGEALGAGARTDGGE